MEIISVIIVIAGMWIGANISSIITYKLWIPTQLRIYYKSRDNIRNLVKGNWRITDLSWRVFKEKGIYKIFVNVKNPLIFRTFNRTCDNIHVDKNGKILKEKLTEQMKVWEEYNEYKRTKKTN